MKSPIDSISGRIVDYNHETHELTIKARYPSWPTLLRRQYDEVEIRLKDGRRLSSKQRNAVYALLREISNYTGQGLSSTKEAMKRKFLDEELCDTGAELFSLSDAPVSLVCAFQRYLVNFVLEYDIPCNYPVLDFVDDVGDYLYACLSHRKCCVCGRVAELHHVDHVAMGRDREEIIHEGLEVLPLCRNHHTIAHTIGDKAFKEKYHIWCGVILDKVLCREYGLRTLEEDETC